MAVRVHRRRGLVSIRVSRAAVAEAEEVWPGVLVGYDAHGVAVGIDLVGQVGRRGAAVAGKTGKTGQAGQGLPGPGGQEHGGAGARPGGGVSE